MDPDWVHLAGGWTMGGSWVDDTLVLWSARGGEYTKLAKRMM